MMDETAKVAKNSNRDSKPGERRGGRKPGTPNKVTAELREEIAGTGELPLEYMIRVMRDEGADDVVIAWRTARLRICSSHAGDRGSAAGRHFGVLPRAAAARC
jgi:hypothetical protein